jgi:hypothetical protein
MPTKQEIHEFLLELRDSGETNMFGASPYLQQEFGMTQYEAKDALLEWMQSFRKETI